MSEQAVKNLVFLEFVDEAEKFLSRFKRELKQEPGAFKIISFHPKVKAYLKAEGIGSTDSYIFCPTASHQLLLEQLNAWTEQMRQGCTLCDAQGIRQSYKENLIFFTRAILSTWLYRVEVIKNAVNANKPQRIICCGELEIGVVKSAWTESCERYLADLIRQQQKRAGFQLDCIDIDLSGERGKFNRHARMRQLGADTIGLLGRFIKPRGQLILAPREDHGLAVILKELRQAYPGEDIAVLYKPAKNLLMNFCEALKGKGNSFRYLFFNADPSCPISREFEEQMSGWRALFAGMIARWDYAGFKPGTWLQKKFDTALESEVITKTYFQSVNLARFLKQWRPRFILAPHARGITAVLGELAQMMKIPSLLIPHGSFTPTEDRFAAMEWKENSLGMVDTAYQYLALQTPLIEQYIQHKTLQSHPVVTGPLILGRMTIQKEKNKMLRQRFVSGDEKIILHAGTPKHRRNQRLLNYETIDEYVGGIESLIKAAEGLKGVHVVIRFREIDGLTQQELQSILPATPNYSIASDGNFSDYLSIADLLVSYSSTTMEEALQNNIPVLVFNRHDRYQHLKGTLLDHRLHDLEPSAVYNVNSDAELPFAIRWILENHLIINKDRKGLFSNYRYAPEKIVKLTKIIESQLFEEAAMKGSLQ